MVDGVCYGMDVEDEGKGGVIVDLRLVLVIGRMVLLVVYEGGRVDSGDFFYSFVLDVFDGKCLLNRDVK